MSTPVWRRPDFALLLVGQTVSEVGSNITEIALPTLAVIDLKAAPAALGLLVAAQRIPFPLLSLVAGALVDRTRKRPLMIGCNLGRLIILVCIPVLAAAGALQFWHLVVAALGMGVFTVFFDIAYLAYVPTLIEPSAMLEANSRLEVTFSVARFFGPGVGGLLIQLVTAARALLVDAGSFAVSMVTIALIRHHEPRPDRQSAGNLLGEIAGGLRHVFSSPVLRAQILFMGGCGLFAHSLEAPLYLFAYNDLHLSPGLLGAMLAAEGVGGLLGSLVATPITRRLGPGPTIALLDGAAVALGGLIVLGTHVNPVLLFFPVFLLIGVTATVGNVSQVTLRQSLSPVFLQGRMTAVFRTVFWGVWPLGNLLGGIFAGIVGPSTTIWVAAIIGTLISLAIYFTPLWAVREFGHGDEVAAPESNEPVTDGNRGSV